MPKKGKKEAEIIDNTNDAFDFTPEKNAEFDFGDDEVDENEIPAETPKKKINIVLTDAPQQRKTSSFAGKISLPPSKQKLKSKTAFDKGIDALESGNFDVAKEYFGEHMKSLEKEQRKESELCLAYIICCKALTALNDCSDPERAVVVSSILVSLPLLPAHRRVVVEMARDTFLSSQYRLTPSLCQYYGIDESVNVTKHEITHTCWKCGQEHNSLEQRCECGCVVYFDCQELVFVSQLPVRCEKCGAIFKDGQICHYCESPCHPIH